MRIFRRLSPPLRQYRLALAVALAGTVVSFIMFLTVRSWQQARAAEDFADLASDRADVLQRDLAGDIRNLKSVARFLESNENTTQAEFAHFVATEIFRESPDILAVLWAPRVAAAGSGQNERFPVRYAEPPERGREAIGWDLAADSAFHRALVRARDADAVAVVVSRRFGGIGPSDSGRTISLVLPVSAQGPAPEGVEKRRRLTGFVVQAVGIAAHLEHALADLRAAGVDLYLLDERLPKGERLLHFHSSRTRGGEVAGDERDLAREAPLSWTTTWNIGGVSWEIVARPAAAFLDRHRDWQSPTVLGGGLLFWALLAGFIASLTHRTAEVERRVKEALAEVKQLQGQYRELVEFSSDLVWKVDGQGRWTFLNAASRTIYGGAPEAFLGRPFAERVDPAFLPGDQGAFGAVLGGGVLADHETVHRDLAGAPRHLSFSAHPVRDESGMVVGAHGTARDVTQRVAVRESLRKARVEAEQATAAKAAFLAGMSHEIRTPMNGVLGMTELLLDSDLTAEQRRSLEMVQSSAESLLTIIDDILDFSKIEAGRLELEEIPFDLPGLVHSALRLLAVRAAERQLELIVDVRPDVPRWVRGDPGRLRQVLNNLMGNALKFTPKGEIAVSVSVGDVRSGAAVLRFAVRDSGIGIAPEHKDKIFEEFSQADVSTTRKYGGTGLGLAISRRLVERMGGDLRVESEPGRGSEFAFSIPLTIEPTAAPEVREHDAAQLVGARVLVVDDNATNRRVVRDMLGVAGSQVGEAVDADAALQALESAAEAGAPYDLAVLDAHMPGQDGFELAGAVRRRPALAGTRLMMLTSSAQRGDAQRCRDLGITGYLLKPASRVEVIEAVLAVLSGTSGDGGLVTRHSIEETRRRLKILLAEDNRVNQEVAATMLRRRGHEVDVAGNGREAVEAASRAGYDVVLMDIQMPEMDGFAATRAIRNLPRGGHVPIVALTAHAFADERERCLEHGMSGYVAKPFKPHELFAAVEGWGAAARSSGPAPAPGLAAEEPVDVEAFCRVLRDAGIEDQLPHMVQLFLDDAPGRLAALEQAFATADAPAIERAAHAFKSAAGTVRANRLAELLTHAELAARSGDTAAATDALAGIRRAVEAATRFLKQQGFKDSNG